MTRALIAGAGIAGPGHRRDAARSPADVDVVERAAGPDQGGTGLFLPGNATRALRRLALRKLILRRAGDLVYRAPYRPLLAEP